MTRWDRAGSVFIDLDPDPNPNILTWNPCVVSGSDGSGFRSRSENEMVLIIREKRFEINIYFLNIQMGLLNCILLKLSRLSNISMIQAIFALGTYIFLINLCKVTFGIHPR